MTLLLFTLALGYLAAMGSLYWSLKDADGDPAWSIHDVIVHYRGSGRSRLETMVTGPMKKELEKPDEELPPILNWLRATDRTEDAFQDKVWPIIDSNCTSCHAREPADADGGQPDAPLESYDDVMVFVKQVDTGISYRTLARMSHAHLFGIGGLMAGLSLILWCTGASIRFKGLVSCAAFVATVGDVASWWLVKISAVFAYVSGTFGGLLGVCTFLFVVVPLYDMWFQGRGSSSQANGSS